MFKEKKDIVYLVLLLSVTAILFFILGAMASSVLGIDGKKTTRIEYVPVSTTTTVAKTTTDAVTTTTTVKTTTNVDLTTTSAATSRSSQTTTAAKGTDVGETTIKRINLNTATKEELMTIKGIGETYAQRILDYRDEIGGFDYLEQLKEISGVGEGRYNAWSPYLYVE